MKRSRRSRRALGGLLDSTSISTVALATGGVVALAAWFLLRPKEASALEMRKARPTLPPQVLRNMLRDGVIQPPPSLRRGQPAPAVLAPVASGASAPVSPSDAVAKADPCFGLTGQDGLNCRSDTAMAELALMNR